MKRCSTCNSLFPDTEKFCELDGNALSVEPSESAALADIEGSSKRSLWPIAAIGGVIIGVLVALVYLALSSERGPKPSAAVLNSTTAQPQITTRPSPPPPREVPSPSVEVSPSPSPSAEPSPSVQPSPERVTLSANPISTAGGKDTTGPVKIKLNSGVDIDADEAWQTTEGIWYRRGGMVSLLNPKDIKEIDKRKPDKP